MQVIGITSNDSDYTVAILKRHEDLDPDFAEAVTSLDGWAGMSEDELLDAQTFVAWYRGRSSGSKSIQDCLENETYAWGEASDVQEVPYK